MLFVEALETVKCLDEGVIESVADANIGSIIGIGFPGWTGGVLQYINGYSTPRRTGPAAFVARARELAATYGERFEPPASLVEKAERGEIYSDEAAAADGRIDRRGVMTRDTAPRARLDHDQRGARSWTAPPACWRRGPTARSRWRTLQRPRV